MDESKQDLTY